MNLDREDTESPEIVPKPGIIRLEGQPVKRYFRLVLVQFGKVARASRQ